MTALSADRMTPQRQRNVRSFPVKAAATIYAGGMAAIDATGNLVAASAVAALKVVGRNERRVTNSGADGSIRADVKPGTFRWANSASTDLITAADIGNDCYVVDDQTVAKTSNSNARPVAGTIYDVDSQGVWVTTKF
ncbi:hypothetical protein [Oryzifoliimicrobium ureilyticus]|uniref:hypothetical protein n=1 Tax=Oryzifoliimicrobium ureilyticus TaxID=3113724 RepID=UPI00307631F4